MPEYSGPVTHVELALVPLWLIVLFPLLGAAFNAFVGWKLQSSRFGQAFARRHHIGPFPISLVGVTAIAISFVLALINVGQLLAIDEPGHRYLYSHAWKMVRVGSLDVDFAFAMDTLGAVMALVVTGVSMVIHIYATSYMEKDPAYWRFFAYKNLFVFAMLLLVLGDNFVVMFFGWEGVGLCSYLLIGFWYRDWNKASAGTKAFIVNRIGDFGFICGIALLFWGLGGAWLGESGQYLPDFRARFIAVQAEEIAHGHGAHAEAHPSGHEQGEHAQAEAAHADAHQAADERAEPHKHATRAHAHAMSPTELRRLAGKSGTLSFTSHAGAKVFIGVTDMTQLEGQPWSRCPSDAERVRQHRARHGAEAKPLRAGEFWTLPDSTQPCYAVAPFLRKPIPAGGTPMAIAPGDGAVVHGNGDEVASLQVWVEPERETVIATVGPTLTFRAIHDQMVIKDASGRQFLREALMSKTVWGGMLLITLACLLFFVGATGKSAQIPLFTWLPDAMAGPTPVSALIHAATMVTAGVYMVARLNFLFSLSATACAVVAGVGCLTAIFAASIGFFQYDIKKVLAYSTVSQLGFMFIGVGVGAYWAAVFHLMTHAFFKACLFLGSGSVIHGMHHVAHDDDAAQDMRNMGGLKRVMPWTARTYFISCLAITAAPIPFFAGFWSKDEILWKAFNALGTGPIPGPLLYAVGLVAALGTSFYMWRSYYLTFEGKHAMPAIAKKVHESPGAMVGVLIVLAALSAVSGVALGLSSHFTAHVGEGLLPAEPLFEQWLHPATAHAETHFGDAGYGMMSLLLGVAGGGALAMGAVARRRYGAGRPEDWAAREKALPGFWLLHNKYFVDEIYDRSVVRAVHWLRLHLAATDKWIVDGLVNGSAMAGRAAAWLSGAIDKYFVDWLVNLVAESTLGAGRHLRKLQTGRIQSYLYGIAAGIVVVVVLIVYVLPFVRERVLPLLLSLLS